MNTKTHARRRQWLVVCLVVMAAAGIIAQTGGRKITRRADVIYGRSFGLALTMEVFTPPKRNGLGVVWVVSSSGRSSRDQTLQGSFERRIGPFLEHGYMVFAVIHGSAPLFNVQDQVGDVRRAVRFVRYRSAEFGIDGQRLGISGSSAGGLLALLVGTHEQDGNLTSDDVVERESSRVQAAGCFFSPTDLQNFGAPEASIIDVMRQREGNVDPSFQFYDVDAKTGARRPLNAREEVTRMLHEYSPVMHVTPGDPPTILIHGDQDKAVPLQQSRRLIDRLTDAAVPARLVVREGVGHAYPGWESDAALIADWFDTHLRRVRQ
jgi:dipeptidyl aminopeptidase/acylaminoacyl peptidase